MYKYMKIVRYLRQETLLLTFLNQLFLILYKMLLFTFSFGHLATINVVGITMMKMTYELLLTILTSTICLWILCGLILNTPITKSNINLKTPTKTIIIHLLCRYFTWDSTKFPHPMEMQQNLTSLGRHLVVIIDPHIKRESGYFLHNEALANGYYVNNKDGSVYEGNIYIINQVEMELEPLSNLSI